MPMPASAPPGAPTPIPMQRPAAANAVQAKPSPPFRLRFLPTVIGLYDLTDAPAAALAAAGLAPGQYWLPEPTQMAATPGAGGVMSEEGWGVAEILAGGYREVESSIRARGGVLLDAWIDVRSPYLPTGAADGPLLREQAVTFAGQIGRRYMTPWERLDAAAPGRPARVVFDRTLMGCWIASLVRAGTIPEAHPAIVAEKRAAGAERVARKAAEVNLPSDVRDRRIAAATSYAQARDGAQVVSHG
jgi:hypothetical protein